MLSSFLDFLTLKEPRSLRGQWCRDVELCGGAYIWMVCYILEFVCTLNRLPGVCREAVIDHAPGQKFMSFLILASLG